MELKETIDMLNIRDYFRYEPVVEYGKDSVKIISTHNESLDNELLRELIYKGITLKSIDTDYKYETEFRITTCTMWEFAPMNSLS